MHINNSYKFKIIHIWSINASNKRKQTCILKIYTNVDVNTWFTHIKDKKLHYVPSLRCHSNKNIKSSVNLPINVISKQFVYFQQGFILIIHINSRYAISVISMLETKSNILFQIYVTMATQISNSQKKYIKTAFR